ncbi:MAG: protein NrnU [Burkholderiales bacterium PBB3]|nr:MAG: protein NrnU [Burkholderiales bacterium PBB3]
MAYLILGLVLFLGVHSVRIVAEGWRTQAQARWGEGAYKGIYTVISLVGLGLIVWGFGVARETPTMLWMPPRGMRHAAALLTLIAFVLLAAAYVPRNAIKARLHHPMVLAVKTWALAHLLANGSVAHVILFGAFLAWGVANFIAARKRDRALGTTYPAGTVMGTVTTVVVGVAAWAAVAFWLHGMLIGIRPLG